MLVVVREEEKLKMIKIKVDVRETKRGLNKITKSQAPFAEAKSLTELAKKSQKGVRRNTEKKFDLRAKKFVLRGIKIKPAKKDQFNLHSMVFTDRKIDFMVQHEKGAIRRPDKAKAITVPSFSLVKQDYRTASGKVRKRLKPSTLLKRFNQTRGTRGKKSKIRVRQAFIVDTKGKNKAIARRRNKQSNNLDFMYIFRERVKIKRQWGFEKAVRGIVRNNYRRVFAKNLNQAIKTAR